MTTKKNLSAGSQQRGTASEKGLRNRKLKEVDIFNNSNYINN